MGVHGLTPWICDAVEPPAGHDRGHRDTNSAGQAGWGGESTVKNRQGERPSVSDSGSHLCLHEVCDIPTVKQIHFVTDSYNGSCDDSVATTANEGEAC